MARWLLKSEPDVFSYADLERAGREPWNGVRNYQARNFLREMRAGDLALAYHSQSRPGVAGIARVVRSAYPDDLQFDPASAYFDPKSTPGEPRWSAVDVAPLRALPRFVPLSELRAAPELADFTLLRKGNRLSVMPVEGTHWDAVLRLGGLDPAEVA